MSESNINPPWHPGVYSANTVSDWMPTDTKEIFDQLVQEPHHYEYFKHHGWLEPSAITYKINSNGFRCDEFDYTSSCIIALGCSYTVGIGLPLESTWPTLVGNALGIKVYNLAWGGSSADTCFRMAEYWIPKLKPTAVFMLTPPTARIELIMAPGNTPPVEVFLPMSESRHFSPSDVYLKHWFINETNAQINSKKNKLAIGELCRLNNAKFSVLDSATEMSCSRDIVGYARDYMHAGPRGHQILAEKFIKQHNE